MAKNREKWIDYIKTFACILVASGHFFMSMVESEILLDTTMYRWFIRTIYYFHVPLFFMCSGYLYQKKSKIDSYLKWKNSVSTKAITLGIPYFVFSIATWMLKAVFSGSVNTKNEGLLTTLFLEPASPYWYLYTLFFIFLITPTFTGRKQAIVGLLIAIALKYIQADDQFEIKLYAVNKTFDNLIWFVFGMCLSVFNIPERCKGKNWKTAGVLCGILFLVASCIECGDYSESVSVNLMMGLLGCLSTFLIILCQTGENKVWCMVDKFSKYTMPVYLMHTIFAAGVRAVLMKLGIDNAAVHIVIGLAASFMGPAFASWLMECARLDFLLYPGKYLKCKLDQGVSI